MSLLHEVALRRTEDDWSQFGEGRIISECLDRMGIDEGTAVEFGAGDGIHLSNTRHLAFRPGWEVVMVESDSDKVVDLHENYATNPQVLTSYNHVAVDNVNEVVPADARVVSIDVDGYDYAILSAMAARPYVLCVEHHPMAPIHVAEDFGPDHGCSAGMLCEWAAHNGYLPVAMTHCNTIMVPARFADAFGDVETDPRIMFDPSAVTWVLSNVRTGDYEIRGPWPFGRGVGA